MNFLTKIFRGTERKFSRGRALHFVNTGTAVWSDSQDPKFSREAYKINPVAYAAINKIGDAVASIQWMVEVDKELIREDHPYLDLLANPNPMQTNADWWKTEILYLLVYGNSYDELRLDTLGRPKELWQLRPDRTSVLPSRTGMPGGYEYKVGGKKVFFPANPITGESLVRHIKLPGPLDDWYGQSPLFAGARAIDQHNESAAWVQALLQNSARPSGALEVDKDTNLTDEQFARLKAEIEENFEGADNAGRPLLLEGGMKWQQLSMSPMDMEVLKIKDSAARDIALALGVPPLLLNIPGDNTYSNYREARLGFYEDCVLPLVRYHTEQLNKWLSKYYEGAKLKPNLDAIEAIAEKRYKMWDMANQSDDITVNESRRMKGLDPLPGPVGGLLMAEFRARTTPTAPTTSQPQEQTPSESTRKLAYGTNS